MTSVKIDAQFHIIPPFYHDGYAADTGPAIAVTWIGRRTLRSKSLCGCSARPALSAITVVDQKTL
jgi:hypothetical protein